MSSILIEKLKELGVSLRDYGTGEHVTTCPRCSHLRKKKRLPCLSVKIEADLILYYCHHCGFAGGLNEHGATANTTHRPGYRPDGKAG
jgi:hypothetical protein